VRWSWWSSWQELVKKNILYFFNQTDLLYYRGCSKKKRTGLSLSKASSDNYKYFLETYIREAAKKIDLF